MVDPRPPRPVPPHEAWRPARVEQVPGTPYGLVILGAPTVTSGPAVGALVAGVAAIVVAVVVTCFGTAGAAAGWGAWVAGAFAVLATFLSLAGIGLGVFSLWQTRPPCTAGRSPGARAAGLVAGGVRGRGLAVAGLACGAGGLGLTVLALVTVLLLSH